MVLVGSVVCHPTKHFTHLLTWEHSLSPAIEAGLQYHMIAVFPDARASQCDVSEEEKTL